MKNKQKYETVDILFQALEKSPEDIVLSRDMILNGFLQNHENTKKKIDKLLEISIRKGYQEGEAIAYNLLGYYYEDLDRNLEARENHLKSWQSFRTIGNKLGQAKACNGLMTASTSLDDYKEAVEWGEKGIQLCYEENEYGTISILSINLADAYFKSGDYLGAYNIISNLEKLPIETDSYLIIIPILNKAHAAIELGYIEETVELLEKCYSLLDKNSMWFLTEIQFVNTKLYLKQGLYDKALEMIQNSYKSMNESGYVMIKADILIVWARIFGELNQYVNAKEKLELAEEIAKEKNLNSKLELIYLVHCEQNKKQKNFEKALEYAKLSYKIRNENRENICSESLLRIKAKHAEITAEIFDEINKSMEDVISLGLAIVNNLSIETMFENISQKIKTLTNVEAIQIQLNTEQGMIKYNINELGYHEENPDYKYYINEPIESQNKIIGSVKLFSEEQDVFGVGGVYKARLISAYLSVALENIQLMKNALGAAELDFMTGILNRKSIMEKLIEFSKFKEKEYPSTSVIMVDIDDFKGINDKFGHLTGDLVIKKVAEKISEEIRESDFCGRIGGEEFLVILPGLDIEKGKAVAERIRESIQNSILEGEHQELIKFTASFGVANLNFSGLDINKIIEQADKELYEAKRNGKNMVCG